MNVKKGDTVKVEYEGTLDDGTVFDSSKVHGTPLEFKVGEGRVIPGFENAIVGMKKGDEKEIAISKEEAYGERNEQLLMQVPKEKIPDAEKIQPGIFLVIAREDGQKLPVKVASVDSTSVTLDLNHPLAGQNLHFKLKVVDIIS